MSVAKPLTCEEVEDLETSGMTDLVVRLEGKHYNLDDLFRCSCCDDQTPRESDLNEAGECAECEEANNEADAEVAALMADWRSDRL